MIGSLLVGGSIRGGGSGAMVEGGVGGWGWGGLIVWGGWQKVNENPAGLQRWLAGWQR